MKAFKGIMFLQLFVVVLIHVATEKPLSIPPVLVCGTRMSSTLLLPPVVRNVIVVMCIATEGSHWLGNLVWMKAWERTFVHVPIVVYTSAIWLTLHWHWSMCNECNQWQHLHTNTTWHQTTVVATYVQTYLKYMATCPATCSPPPPNHPPTGCALKYFNCITKLH